MKRLTIGILAHVDAGKTTLSEALLYNSGAIERLGRVDKGNAFLDTFSLEKERGITIFSKQAHVCYKESEITLIDTPGHIDFSCDTERALSIEDYAILVVSAPNGIEAHTKTLWKLLRARKIPTFIFVNKLDISQKTKAEIMGELKNSLSGECVNMKSTEDIAGADEELMDEFFSTGDILDTSVAKKTKECRLFPVYFGSALKNDGVKEFLDSLVRFTLAEEYSQTLFGARVYKIGRDKTGNRLSYVKITGRGINAKSKIKLSGEDEEKVEEIRIYSAEKYTQIKEAKPGMVVALTGLSKTYAGMGLGFEEDDKTILEPVLEYKINLPGEENPYECYMKFLSLLEEEPSLALRYEEGAYSKASRGEIRVRLMGEIQLEVLSRLIKDRFNLSVSFSEGAILYKETISTATYGSGHFEPLRHYAEVHLRLEPLPRGAGIICESDCSTDILQKNWQRLILTHLEEKSHRGVLIGEPITDIKISLCAGKAHVKHTEGGDFRQATYRAVRQGLMKAQSLILEPSFDFSIELPREHLGRAMTDVSAMHGSADAPIFEGELAILTGNCPVSTMRSYAMELRAYTRGEGKITLTPGKYIPCHNSDEVISERKYNPELDERNTPNSVFCKNGSGYVVPWNEADALMHVEASSGEEEVIYNRRAVRSTLTKYNGTAEEDRELERIFEATYGKIKPRTLAERTENAAEGYTQKSEKPKKLKPKGDDYLIIDGYNLIFAWDRLKSLCDKDFSLARDTLITIMCNYSSFKKVKAVIVFDAYKNRKGEGSEEKYGNVLAVYTREGQTADSYIEKLAYELAREHSVRVVTSDLQEQLMVLGVGALRVSAREFAREISITEGELAEIIDSLK